MEVFGLTRWESAENHSQNYTSIGTALVMLAFMSTGYEFNAYFFEMSVTLELVMLTAKAGINICMTSESRDRFYHAVAFTYFGLHQHS